MSQLNSNVRIKSGKRESSAKLTLFNQGQLVLVVCLVHSSVAVRYC
jgi:hypothetical protein